MKNKKDEVSNILKEYSYRTTCVRNEDLEITKEVFADKILQLFQPSEQWKFIDAVNAVKSGSHQIERDCDNLDLLKAVLKAAFPKDHFNQKELDGIGFYKWKRACFIDYKNTFSQDKCTLPLIKLSEIQPEEVKINHFENALKAENVLEYLSEKIEPEFKNGDEVLMPCALCSYHTSLKGVSVVVQQCDYHNTRLRELKQMFQSINHPFMTDEIAEKYALELYNEEKNGKL